MKTKEVKVWVTKRLGKKQSAAEAYANRPGNYGIYDYINYYGQLCRINDIPYVKKAFEKGWEAAIKHIKK